MQRIVSDERRRPGPKSVRRFAVARRGQAIPAIATHGSGP